MKQTEMHVIYSQGKWKAKWRDGKRATKTFTRQENAVRFARRKAAEVVIHNKDGSFRRKMVRILLVLKKDEEGKITW